MALAALNNLFFIAKLPLPINIIALFINVIALSISVTALFINIAAPPINIIEVLWARLNYTLNSLAIGLKSAQPIATAIILLGTQTPTPITP